MGAPVASGTRAGSTSGSSAGIRKEAASSDLPDFRRHPPGLAQLCRRRGGRTPSSGTTSPPRKQQREIGVTDVARFIPGEGRPSELPVVSRRPPVVASAQFGDHRQSRRPGRPGYRNRGEAVAPRRSGWPALRRQTSHELGRGDGVRAIVRVEEAGPQRRRSHERRAGLRQPSRAGWLTASRRSPLRASDLSREAAGAGRSSLSATRSLDGVIRPEFVAERKCVQRLLCIHDQP